MALSTKPRSLFADVVWANALVPAFVYLIGYAVLTWPAITAVTTEFLTDTGDGLANYWNFVAVGDALTELRSPWHTDRLFHPDGVTLIGQTLNPFNGAVGVPLRWLFSPLIAFNLIVIGTFVLTGLTTFWLARYTGSRYGPSLFVGFVFTFSCYRFAHAYGHLNLMSLQFVPLFLLLWLELLRAPRWRLALGAAVTLGLVATCSHNYTFFCVLAGMLIAGWHALQHRRSFFTKDRLVALAVFVAGCAVCVVPLFLALVAADRDDPMIGAHDPNQYGLDLLAPFVPSGAWWLRGWTEWYWGSLPGNPIETANYLRWSLIVPFGYALWHRRELALRDAGAWGLLGVAFLLFSLGPQLQLAGHQLAVPMPYDALAAAIPQLRIGGVPVRMFIVTILCVYLTVGAVLPLWWRALGRWGIALWVAVLAVETWPARLPRFAAVEPDWVSALRELPAGAVAGLDGNPVDMLSQTRFDKPLTNGYLARRPRSRNDRKAEQRRLRDNAEYVELVERTQARYLVLPKFRRDDAALAEFRCVARGGTHDVFVRRDDPLPSAAPEPRDCASGDRPRVTVERDDSGAPVALVVTAPAHRGRRAIVALSTATGPPIPLGDGRSLPLGQSSLLDAALQQPSAVVTNNRLELGADGRARLELALDRTALRGTRIHYCAAILYSTAERAWLDATRYAVNTEICRLSAVGSVVLP